MGLTREQWQNKRIKEICDYVEKNGRKVKGVPYWDTYPICIKDVCTLGAAIIDKELVFVDFVSPNFNVRKEAKNVERRYLEEVLEDMKQLDKNKN